MADSIFTKIINGEIPSHKVYEDDKTLAFMEIDPITEGHVLVVSKKQLDIWDLPNEDYQALLSSVKKVAKRVKQVYQPKRVGIQIVGLHIPNHAHVHVFPFNTIEEYRRTPDADEPDHTALSEQAKKLAF